MSSLGLLVYANNAETTLAGAISNTATTANLAAGSGALFPNPGAGQYFALTFTDAATGLLHEIVYVTARSGDTITMVRGQEGTDALNWLAGDLADNLWTAGSAESLAQLENFAGNPNGALAGIQYQSLCWDSTHALLWVCTNTGSASTATWSTSAALASGHCQLQFSSSTAIKLVPMNGTGIVIDGVQYNVSTTGISAANSGVYVNGSSGQNLAASTVYYVSLASVAGTLTLRFWAQASYSHGPDTTAGNVGTEVITSSGTPMPTDTLVGMVATNSSSQFSATLTRSWFNRNQVAIQGAVETATTTSTTFVDLGSNLHVTGLVWANEAADFSIEGTAFTSIAGEGADVQLAIDAATVGIASVGTSAAASYDLPSTVRYATTALSEGTHVWAAYGLTEGGATATYIIMIVGRIG